MRNPLYEIEQLANNHALPSDHGVRRFLTLAKFGPSKATAFVKQLGLGLQSRTEDSAKNASLTIASLNRVFKGLDVQSNDNATQVITALTRHCINVGLQPQDILYAAQGSVHEEVMAVLRMMNIVPAKQIPFPKAPQKPSAPVAAKPLPYGKPPGPPPPQARPLGPYIQPKPKKKP